jgi:hypothetical protein
METLHIIQRKQVVTARYRETEKEIVFSAVEFKQSEKIKGTGFTKKFVLFPYCSNKKN